MPFPEPGGCMGRREFITALGGAVATTAWPSTALARDAPVLERGIAGFVRSSNGGVS